MELLLFAIRDSKANYFNAPMVLKTHGEAERTFNQLATDPNSNISRYPEDFDLYYLGKYDNITGKMSLQDSPQHMVNAVHIAKPANTQSLTN